ncbi:MAG: hemolysin family protein [Tissierellaceae bacterium]|nr:HlyC/CorC family transporter [Tissierellia bacterium]
MDSGGWIKIILLFSLLLGAAYCASSEIAFASLNKIRVKKQAENGDKKAMKALYVTENFDKALTTILIGNNLTHIGFASLVTLIATQTWGLGSVKYATIFSTIVVFLLSEMIPKSYGKSNYKYALAIAGSLSALMKIFTPFSYFFTIISNFISNMFSASDEPEINEEEFYEIMTTAEEEGVLDKERQELIHSALDFDVIKAGDILTPIDQVESIDINWPIEDILSKVKSTRYSRLPVYSGNKDKIIGILRTKEFLKQYIRNDSIDLRKVLRKPRFINKNIPIDDLLRKMSREKNHISIIVNKDKKVVGIITVEDILEELVGDIWDEEDVVKGVVS